MEKIIKISNEDTLHLIELTKVTVINVYHLLDLNETVDKTVHYYDDVFASMKPEKPIKPILPISHNSNQVKQYQLDLEKWESVEKIYRENKQIYNNMKFLWEKLCEEFIKHKTDFYESVPKGYQDKIYKLAWDYGHSGGYLEVYQYLIDLVDIFE